MALIKWDDEFSVKVRKMDDQHKKLFDILNRLHDYMKKGEATKNMPSFVKELLEYTEYHFSEEEALMEKAGYSGLDEQKRLHGKYIDEIRKLKEKCDSGKPVFASRAFEFLKDWLFDHIKVVDKKYSDFLNRKGIK